jgi:hypothetical protein
MSLTAVKIKNDGDVYSPFKRYRVNAVVEYQGATYQNVTGINSLPSPTSANWLLVKEAPSGLTTLLVNGNPFTLVKNPANLAAGLEVNDMVTNGFWDSATFWLAAYYLGPDKDLITSWAVISAGEELPQN